jgi:hypothetical protein
MYHVHVIKSIKHEYYYKGAVHKFTNLERCSLSFEFFGGPPSPLKRARRRAICEKLPQAASFLRLSLAGTFRSACTSSTENVYSIPSIDRVVNTNTLIKNFRS